MVRSAHTGRMPRPLLAEHIALGGFVHRAASNREDKYTIPLDREQRTIPPRSLPVEELVDGFVNNESGSLTTPEGHPQIG